jgi:hypothetical protein
MREYRFYTLGGDDHVARPPDIVECQDDQEAIAKALYLFDGAPIEIWDGERLVRRRLPWAAARYSGPGSSGAL